MPPGDDSDQATGSEIGGPTAGEPADAAPARGPHIDPAVEIGWLGRRIPRPRRRPRPTTVLLVVAFTAVLVLYLILQPA
ncbi:hypothetical protein [Nocardia sp. NPDC024068]|uniref:hypothetical protein n=1 Tax=Nocardia sp. NPDC024068 TaxID=3157197 RepID=UPI0033F22151